MSLLAIILGREAARLFHLTLLGAAQFLATACSICLRAGYAAYNPPERADLAHLLVLEAVQFAAAVISLLLCLSLVRRPELYLRGHAVDGQYTTSLLGRWAFSWANRLLSFAKSNNGLELVDLPKLHLGMRSEQLHEDIRQSGPRSRLWRTLLAAHYVEMLYQILLVFTQAAVQFLPTYAMYRFLQLLEERSEDQMMDGTALAWISGLGLSSSGLLNGNMALLDLMLVVPLCS